MASGLIHSQRFINLAAQPGFSTTFTLTENPISEGGVWVNGFAVGLDWNNMQSAANKCWGQQNAGPGPSGSFRDGTAILTGTFSANQFGQATVFANSPPFGNAPEVEIRLRSVVTANVNRGYEIAFSNRTGVDGYLIIVRWNGPFGIQGVGFDYLLNVSGAQYSVGTGDVIRAEITGNIISAFKNGTLMGTADITSIGGTVWSNGNPGIGHNSEEVGGSHNNLYGFSAFSAGNLP